MKDFIQKMYVSIFGRVCLPRRRSSILPMAGLVLASVSFATNVMAQKTIVKDINVKKILDGSNPDDFTEMNGLMYFKAKSPQNGTELWKSDGTEAGTVMVKDICAGTASTFSSSINLVVMNNTLYFIVNDCVHGLSLWKSDGTEAGTVMVADFFSGQGVGGSFVLRSLINVNGQLYFWLADQVSYGMDQVLWKSDGTPEGTMAVTPRGKVGFVQELTNFNGTLFFSATDGVHGKELWKTDGTDEGTVMVKDINPGWSTDPSEPHGFYVYGNTLYFSARVGMDFELWKTDGTTAGTVRVKDINTTGSSYPAYMAGHNGMVYFRATDGINGLSLWRTDGTPDGTAMVKSLSECSFITEANGALYFTGNDGVHGSELWKSDGTTNGTVMVKDIRDGNSSSPVEFAEVNNTLFFRAASEEGYELWKSDGTAAGTVLVKDIAAGAHSSGPYALTNYNGLLYFAANDAVNGFEFWKSNGTAEGTSMVKEIFNTGSSSFPDNLTKVGEVVFFAANDGVHGSELWKTDGTEAGTIMVKDILPGDPSSAPGSFAGLNGLLYFAAYSNGGYDLWKSDGSEAGTVIVKDFDNDPIFRGPENMVNINGTIFFSAESLQTGRELWKTDGTMEGTVLVKDILPGANSSGPFGFTDVNGTIFFVGNDGVNGFELWKTDGTEAGTVMVKNINPAAMHNFPRELVNLNGTLYFTADDGVHGYELWKSDGTEAGTVLVKDITPGANTYYLYGCRAINGALYFSANNGVDGWELWKSDGTEAGTVLLKDINSGISSGYPSGFTYFDGFIYFSASGEGKGSELWKTDGTEAGTLMVKDLLAGGDGTYPDNLTIVNGRLYFIGWEGTGDSDGLEIWRSNGPACSTVAVTSESESSLYDYPPLIEINGKLVFAASNNERGVELFMHDTTLDGPTCTQTVAFEALADKVFGNAPFPLTATTSSGLSVLFSSSNPEIASVNDNIVTIRQAGSVTITATQAGDRIYIPASASQTLWISKANQTITFNPLPDKRLSDETFILPATASSGLPISYVSSHPDIASIDGNSIILHKAGMIAIAANQAGNVNYEPAMQVPQTLTILKSLQSIAFGELPSRMFGEAPFTLSATASSTLPVVYESSNAAVATVVNNTITLTGAGTTIITATQPGNDAFEAASSVQQTLVVELITDLEGRNEVLVGVYPNPVHDVLNISVASAGQVRIEVFDAMGRVVARETASSGEDVSLQVDHLQPGIYHVKIGTGRQVITRQVVKE